MPSLQFVSALQLRALTLTCALLALPAPGRPSPPPVASQAGTADIVLFNSDVYTVDEDNPWAQAVAILDGELVFVGDNEGARPFIGPQTRVVNLEGRMMLPGFHDSHNHLLEAFHFGFTCPLEPNRPPESYIDFLSFCKFLQLGTDWVIGFGHTIDSLLLHLELGGRPPVEILDEAIPNRPAVMLESTSHSVWANSLALEEAGFTSNTPDPPGGVILKDANGDPNGVLLDGAGEIAMDLAFAPNPDMRQLNYDAVIRGLEQASKNGITSVIDGRTYWAREYEKAYEQVQADGQLTARIVLSLWAYPYLDDDEQLATLSSLYSDDPASRLRASQVKIYSDGEVSHTTANLLSPYEELQLAGETGLNYFDEARLTRYVTELEGVGYDFHVHAIGDRGAQNALNAIEAARITNGDLDRRHHITHLEVLDPQDTPRFAELNVTANVQMSSNFVLNTDFYLPYLGQLRTDERVLRLRDLHDQDARIVLSSDYDVGDFSPFAGIERAITRSFQALPDLETAIRAYTINPAYLVRQQNRLGSLEVGKWADLIVIDRDLFEIDPSEIGETQVVLTMVGGELVYRNKDLLP